MSDQGMVAQTAEKVPTLEDALVDLNRHIDQAHGVTSEIHDMLGILPVAADNGRGDEKSAEIEPTVDLLINQINTMNMAVGHLVERLSAVKYQAGRLR